MQAKLHNGVHITDDAAGVAEGYFHCRRGLGFCEVAFLTELRARGSPPRRRRDLGWDPTGGGGVMTDGAGVATRPETAI